MKTPKNKTVEWDEVTDPLPDTWDELVKGFPQVSLIESILNPQPPDPKVQAFIKRGGDRLREALSNTPFWAEGERKAFEAGGQERVDQYWQGLFMNERNLYRPPKQKT